MITLSTFHSALERFRPPANPEQRDAIDEAPDQPLFIVAGPGTGKTACLTLRVLKLVLVDDIPPRCIVATTFTRKAAAELRSRVLGWGFRLIETLGSDGDLPPDTRDRVARVDINQVLTGTLDSLCEQVLRDYREPGTQPPVMADDYVARTLVLRRGLLDSRRYEDPALDAFLKDIRGGSAWGWHIGTKSDLVHDIWERRFHDQVDWEAFLAGGPEEQQTARQVLGQAISSFQAALSEKGLVDFALVEQEVLDRLRSGRLSEFTEQTRVLLVDEYQDTNLLQESIYFELARASNASLTVVGDEDQSLYRFRGATVELFSQFSNRYAGVFGRQPRVVFLQTNYRSDRRLVDFVDNYARLDAGYQDVRVRDKPRLAPASAAVPGLPVLGMFRDDANTLAVDLSDFIRRVFRGNGFELETGETIRADPDGGDLGDCALLCSSPADHNAGGDPRLPRRLRDALGDGDPPLRVFNPRGQDMTEIPIVQVFGGLLLEALDTGGVVESRVSGLSREMLTTFAQWRAAAVDYFTKEAPASLQAYALAWTDRNPRRAGWVWPPSVPCLDLVYGLVHFFPELHDDAEGQVYLEVFTRQLGACQQVGSFDARVLFDPAAGKDDAGFTLPDRSVAELLRDFLGPIASGTVKVNEDLMDAFPRDRLSVLSVHQAKGLEFPLTIVDVGSDFRKNHHAHAFKRYPTTGGTPHALEELLRLYTTLGAPDRSSRDRSFDDLYRQFFVAFSRPQNVLLLVGLTPSLPGGGVPNVATGWLRSGGCAWTGEVPFLRI